MEWVVSLCHDERTPGSALSTALPRGFLLAYGSPAAWQDNHLSFATATTTACEGASPGPVVTLFVVVHSLPIRSLDLVILDIRKSAGNFIIFHTCTN